MFYKLSERIADGFEKQRVISSEDKELYRYGVQQGLNLLLNLLTTFVIGILCGMLMASILFIVVYMPLRSFAGGYHAKTHLRCYLYSILMITAVLLVIRFLPLGRLICSCLMFVGGIIIVLFAPVEDSNKPLDKVEQYVYRKRTRLIFALECCVFLLSVVLQAKLFYSTISLAIVGLAFLVLMGKGKNVFQEDKEKQITKER